MRRGALILLALAAVLLVVFLLAAPHLQLGSSAADGSSTALSSSSGGASLQQARRISSLEHEIERLKELIAQEQAGTGKVVDEATAAAIAKARADTTVNISLMGLLGLQSFFSGVSWDPFMCSPPYNQVEKWKNVTEAQLKEVEDRLVKDLRAELAKIKGVPVELIDPEKEYHEQGRAPGQNVLHADALTVYTVDPLFPVWRTQMIVTMSKYMPRADAAMILHDTCEKLKGKQFNVEDMGTPQVDCLDEMTPHEVVQTIGYWAMPYFSINLIAKNLLTTGHCMSPVRGNHPSYAHWLRKERIFSTEWMTFAVETPEQDAAVLLFDVLYEKLAIFTKQYWLGVITMQNPFDMYSIQDIIFQTRPTLLIETGTANGGSALLWASIMHLAEMDDSKIVTVDVNPPKWEGDGWGGRAREDPTKHRLWARHVTFIQGDTVAEPIVQQVQAMAAGKKVMVLLDSHHSQYHVSQEMERYCPLVSVGCYCIVEDTKMSRWASDGPLESVKKFIQKHHAEFEIDRSRELLYSHHTLGYLKRIK